MNKTHSNKGEKWRYSHKSVKIAWMNEQKQIWSELRHKVPKNWQRNKIPRRILEMTAIVFNGTKIQLWIWI